MVIASNVLGCESYWGKCESCQRNMRLSGRCETYTGGMSAMQKV